MRMPLAPLRTLNRLSSDNIRQGRMMAAGAKILECGLVVLFVTSLLVKCTNGRGHRVVVSIKIINNKSITSATFIGILSISSKIIIFFLDDSSHSISSYHSLLLLLLINSNNYNYNIIIQ